MEVDALVVGTGPIGATFARKLSEGGCSILMIDAGPQLSKRPEHLKKSFLYRKDRLGFAEVIDRGHTRLSVPVAPKEKRAENGANGQQHEPAPANSAPYKR